MVLAKKIV